MKDKEEKKINKSITLLAKISFFVLIAIIISKVLSYVYRIIIARNFGPEIYGMFSLAIMISGWFIVFSEIGLSDGLLKYISIYRGRQEKNKIRYIFRFSLGIASFLSLLGGVLLFFISPYLANVIFNNPGLEIFFRIFSITVPLTVFFRIFITIIRAYEKIGWYSFIFNIALISLKLISLILLVLIGLGAYSVIISNVFGIGGALIIAIIFCWYSIREIFKNYRLDSKSRRIVIFEFLSYSWPMLFYGLVFQLFSWVDTFAIGYFKGPIEVGLYNAALPIAFLLIVSFEIFSQYLFPAITKEYAKGNKNIIKEMSKQTAKWIFIVNLPLTLLMIFFPGAFLNILFGKEYLAAENALRFLAFGTLCLSVFKVSDQLLAIRGKPKIILLDIIMSTILNILLNWLLIPKYNISGASFATMVSFIFLCSLLTFHSYYYLKIVPIRRKMLSVVGAGIISALFLLYFRQNVNINIISLIILSLFFFLLYIILLIAFKGFDRNDIMIMKKFKNKIFLFINVNQLRD